MCNSEYLVILTNGTVNNKYKVNALQEDQAIILAQAEAIKAARGYKFVSVKLL